MGTRILEAQQTINQARAVDMNTLSVRTVTADKGYYALSELEAMQQEQIKTIIADPINNRRLDKLPAERRQTIKAALRSVKSKYGQELLRRRGMHIERSFAHILDCGGMRRTTLRGWENLNKRFKLAAAVYNLSQLMRKLLGIGTPKQLAASGRLLFLQFPYLLAVIARILHRYTSDRNRISSATPGIFLMTAWYRIELLQENTRC